MYSQDDLKALGAEVIAARRALWDAEYHQHRHPGVEFYKLEVSKARKAYYAILKKERDIVNEIQLPLL